MGPYFVLSLGREIEKIRANGEFVKPLTPI